MSLAIEIELLSRLYEAAGDDPSVAEWPPHPARVFCALVAGSRTDADHEALRWLEGQPAPNVFSSDSSRLLPRSAYVVTNRVERTGGSQFHPGRSNGLRVRAAAATCSDRIRLVWPEAEPDPTTVECLDRLARRVPYIGRSTGVARVSCHAEASSFESSVLTCFEPAQEGMGSYDLRVPFAGYLDALLEQYRDGRPSWEVSRTAAYRRRDQIGGADAGGALSVEAPSAYADVIIMQFERFRPDGELAPLFTKALRRAVMSVTPNPLPAALHGHGSDAAGRPHVAFLALPDVGHEYASGRLLGMAVAIPQLAVDERRTIVRSVLGAGRSDGEGRTFRLNVPRVGEVSLSYRPGLVRPWTLNPRRWRQGSTEWISVTPVVLDRFPRRGDIESEIARSCLAAGLPEPYEVVASTGPLIAGGARLRPRELPEQVRGRIYRHARLRFSCQVAGPLLVGAGRYLGVGLFAPVTTTRADVGVAR